MVLLESVIIFKRRPKECLFHESNKKGVSLRNDNRPVLYQYILIKTTISINHRRTLSKMILTFIHLGKMIFDNQKATEDSNIYE